MTPNEARQCLNQYRVQARRSDALGRVARREMREAYIILARRSLEISKKFRKNRRLAYIEMAGFYRQAAFEMLEAGK